MQLNQQQQQIFAQRLNEELEKVTMSWDNILEEWYPHAIKALNHASVLSLKIPQNKFKELFVTNKHGVNMNLVMVLCNNLEERTPREMGFIAEGWCAILNLNHIVATRWQELVNPIQKQILKSMETRIIKTPIIATV